jgi:peptidyl-tRNA hydrolase
LFVVTREDINPGYQAVQSGHALVEFMYEHPEQSTNWYNISKYLVFLTVKNQKELIELSNKLSWRGVLFSEFHEPDLNNELTAIAIEPSSKSCKLVSSMPLLLKGYEKLNTKL